MAAPSLLSITNGVVARYGRKPVTNVTEREDTHVISQQIPDMLSAMLAMAEWNFAAKFKYEDTPLTDLISYSPQGGYLYNYQLPSDFGHFWRFQYNDYPLFGLPYQILDDRILTSTKPISYWYIVSQVDYNFLPPAFVEALIYYVSAQLALAITQNQILQQDLDKKFLWFYNKAFVQNIMQNPIFQAPNNDFDRKVFV